MWSSKKPMLNQASLVASSVRKVWTASLALPRYHLLLFEEAVRPTGGQEAGSYPTPRHHSWLQILDANTEVVGLFNIFGYKGGSHQTTKLTHKQAILECSSKPSNHLFLFRGLAITSSAKVKQWALIYEMGIFFWTNWQDVEHTTFFPTIIKILPCFFFFFFNESSLKWAMFWNINESPQFTCCMLCSFHTHFPRWLERFFNKKEVK